MIDYIKSLFSGNPLQLIGTIVAVFLVSIVFFVVFHYAKKRNLSVFIVIVCVDMVALLGLSFFKLSSYAFYVYFSLGACAVASLVFFAQDFRRDMFRRKWKALSGLEAGDNLGREELHTSVKAIVKACEHMSKNDTGALIVIADSISGVILDSGVKVDAQISNDIIEAIFFKKAPLHDGAIIIRSNRIECASCYLPLTQQDSLPRSMGTRHRAAIGITETNPTATAIVVSEESGVISAVHDGKIMRYLDAEKLTLILECAMKLKDENEEKIIWGITKNEQE